FECETDYRIFNHLNIYVFSRLMWDTGRDYQEILADYYQKMYGAAAATMQEFFQTLEHHWLIDCFNNEVMTMAGPKANPPTEYQIWNEIYSPAEISRIAALLTKAETQVATEPEALKRVRFMRAQMWQPVEQGAEDYIRKTQAVDKWTAVLHTVPAGEKIVIDGAGTDVAWQSAAEVELLALGKDAVEVHTKVKMLQDADNFYFLFWCEEPKTELMLSQEREYDDPMVWSDNAIEIHLDIRGERQDEYQFMVNSQGVITDLHNRIATLTNDYSFNAQAEAKSIIMEGVAWQTEVRIPKSSFPPLRADGRVIANFTRHRALLQEKVHLYYAWSPYALTFGDLANFGTLIPAAEEEKNLLADGNFTYTGSGKIRPDEWFFWGKKFTRDTEIFRTAGASLKLEHEDASLVYKLPFLKPFTQYRLSFFVRLADIVSSETRGGFYVRIDQGDGNVQYLPDPGYTGTLKWQRLEKVFTTGSLQPRTYTPYIHFCQRKSSGTSWIDAVQLVELGPAPDKK
ncbi:MAG: hypothetical protein GX902_10225, partial [Lentisphaerae bacterium]|nr:hypothetical protein [Lentisphaerota bacterium]